MSVPTLTVDNQDDTPKATSQTESDRKLLRKIRERVRLMIEADEVNRHRAREDIRFLHIPGEQWDALTKQERGNDRPCYEFDKLSIKAQRVINEMRSNRPEGKVRAVEDGDKDTADIYEGLCRNIANVSDFDTVTDYAAEYQVTGGMGAWRVCTEYAEDSVDAQDIRLEAIQNPFSLYADPAAKDPLKRDANDWALIDRMPKADYKAKYPKARVVNFDGESFDDAREWVDETTVRVCEYWYKEPYEKELWRLATGETVDAADPAAKAIAPDQIVKKRAASCERIMMCIASGDAILEGPTAQAGKHHRFIVVYGKWIVVDGKPHWYGLVRKAKDAQRSYNVTRTAVTETIALAPQSKYWATPKQAEGHLDKWAEAHKRNYPVQLFNPDPANPGAPQRMGGADVPVALVQEMQLADQELKDVTGVYDASLGERSNEQSGIAISRRSEQTQIVNFNFPDNMSKGVRRTWEILIDLIPLVYDTERPLRILGKDGAEKYVRVNKVVVDPATGQQVTLNDLSRGTYDVTVTVGPSFSTQRQEAAELYSNMAQQNPALMNVAGDLIMRSMDLPYSEEIGERMKALLPPPIQAMLSKEKPVPPEVQAVMMQAQQAMQQVQQQGLLVQKAAEEAQAKGAALDKQLADLKVARAQFDADVQKALSNIVTQEAALTVMEAKLAQSGAAASSDAIQAEHAGLQEAVKGAIDQIQQHAAQFLDFSLAALSEIKANQPAPPPASAPVQHTRVLAVTRQNGALVPQYEPTPRPGPPPRVKAIVRQNGALIPQYEEPVSVQ